MFPCIWLGARRSKWMTVWFRHNIMIVLPVNFNSHRSGMSHTASSPVIERRSEFINLSRTTSYRRFNGNEHLRHLPFLFHWCRVCIVTVPIWKYILTIEGTEASFLTSLFNFFVASLDFIFQMDSTKATVNITRSACVKYAFGYISGLIAQ